MASTKATGSPLTWHDVDLVDADGCVAGKMRRELGAALVGGVDWAGPQDALADAVDVGSLALAVCRQHVELGGHVGW